MSGKSKGHWAKEAKKGEKAREQNEGMKKAIGKAIRVLCESQAVDFVPMDVYKEKELITQLHSELESLRAEHSSLCSAKEQADQYLSNAYKTIGRIRAEHSSLCSAKEQADQYLSDAYETIGRIREFLSTQVDLLNADQALENIKAFMNDLFKIDMVAEISSMSVKPDLNDERKVIQEEELVQDPMTGTSGSTGE